MCGGVVASSVQFIAPASWKCGAHRATRHWGGGEWQCFIFYFLVFGAAIMGPPLSTTRSIFRCSSVVTDVCSCKGVCLSCVGVALP